MLDLLLLVYVKRDAILASKQVHDCFTFAHYLCRACNLLKPPVPAALAITQDPLSVILDSATHVSSSDARRVEK